jgi:hypothetical protein
MFDCGSTAAMPQSQIGLHDNGFLQAGFVALTEPQHRSNTQLPPPPGVFNLWSCTWLVFV